jgi:Cytosol aminopeptidase family, N-terminal domain
MNPGTVTILCTLILAQAAISGSPAPSADRALPAQGTSRVWGTVDGVAFEGAVEGPSTMATPLQVACVFEYTEGDIFRSPPALPASANGLMHLDQALHGVITDIRKGGRFRGDALETLLITPPTGTVAAKQLLLIGLGPREKFTPDLMIVVGRVAMREALRLGVTRFAFASDLKDAGIDSPTGRVAGNVVRGLIDAYRTQRYLKSKGVADYAPITQVTLLAGPPFFAAAGQGIQDAVASFR